MSNGITHDWKLVIASDNDEFLSLIKEGYFDIDIHSEKKKELAYYLLDVSTKTDDVVTLNGCYKYIIDYFIFCKYREDDEKIYSSYPKIYQWFLKESEKGNLDAVYNLGRCYQGRLET